MRTEETDAVVIGSGTGGLAAARGLAQFGGQRVLVLEQHYTPGGMTHEFSRDGRFHFTTGLHYLSRDPEMFLRFLTDGRLQLAPMPHEYDVLHFPGLDFAVPSSLEEFRQRLEDLFPDESTAIKTYFDQAAVAAEALFERNDLVSQPGPDLIGHERRHPLAYRTTETHISKSFRDPRLRAILSARWALSGPPPDIATFGYHASTLHSYYAGGGSYPVGGGREVGRLAVEGLERFGVEVRVRQRVQRILADDDRVRGVEVLDTGSGEVYRVLSTVVASDTGHRTTYELLGRPAPLASEEGFSCVVLYLGLDRSPAEFGLRGENHWLMADDDLTLYVSFASLNDPAARHHTVEAAAYTTPDLFDRWRGAKDETYEQFKRDAARRILERLEDRWPGIGSAVACSEVATPLTFETFQNSHRGVFYGLPSTAERMRSPYAGPITPVDGLVIAGQDAEMPGVVGALAGGLRAASALLDPEQAGQMWQTVATFDGLTTDRWQGYLRVSAISDLTPSTRLIRLEPLDGGVLPFTFTAGQYLTVDVPVAVEPVARSYSICSGPSARTYVEIAVKREPDGLGSVYLNDELALGQALRVTGPLGDFTSDLSSGSLLFVAGGIGITPMVSMLHAAAAAGYGGPITLLAAYRDHLPFEAELAGLARQLPGLEVRLFPSGSGRRIGLEELRHFTSPARPTHLCGPTSLMKDVLDHLETLGVPRELIHTEAFVSAAGRRTRRERAHAIARAATVPEFRIALPDGTSFGCRPGETVLAAANDAGVRVEQSCEEGVCGSCRVRVLDGPVDSDTGGLFSSTEVADGWRLACQTLPTGDLTMTI